MNVSHSAISNLLNERRHIRRSRDRFRRDFHISVIYWLVLQAIATLADGVKEMPHPVQGKGESKRVQKAEIRQYAPTRVGVHGVLPGTRQFRQGERGSISPVMLKEFM